MAAPRPSTSTAASGGRVCPRLLAVVTILVGLPGWSWALDAQLRWTPSPDSVVKGYYVYVRQAKSTYGPPVDVGAPQPAADGTLSWIVTGLSPTTTYFIAVSAYAGTGIESALSGELPLGTPDPCALDVCSGPTQCTIGSLPDGTACGAAAAGSCGSACQAGSCLGAAQSGFAVTKLKVKRSDAQLRAAATGKFASSSLFDPVASGLQLTVVDGTGTVLVQVALPPASLVASPDGSVVKLARRQGTTAQVQLRRLTLKTRNGYTLVKLRLYAPPPPALPQSATVMLQAGSLCLTGAPSTCRVQPRILSCG